MPPNVMQYEAHRPTHEVFLQNYWAWVKSSSRVIFHFQEIQGREEQVKWHHKEASRLVAINAAHWNAQISAFPAHGKI